MESSDTPKRKRKRIAKKPILAYKWSESEGKKSESEQKSQTKAVMREWLIRNRKPITVIVYLLLMALIYFFRK